MIPKGAQGERIHRGNAIWLPVTSLPVIIFWKIPILVLQSEIDCDIMKQIEHDTTNF